MEFSSVPDLRLDDDFFEYKGRKHQYSEINSIEFGAVVTKNSVNFVPAGKSFDAKLAVFPKFGNEFDIKPVKGWFGGLKEAAFGELQRVNAALSFMTFNYRAETYEEQLKESNLFRMGGYEFHKNGNLSKSGKFITNLKDGSHSFLLGAFNVTISKKKKSVAEKLKASWSGESTIYIGKDRDCFIYLMSTVYGLRWSSETVSQKRVDNKRIYYETVVRLGAWLSAVDGNADPKELQELKRFFQLEQSTFPAASKIFNEQLKSPRPLRDILIAFNSAFRDATELKQSLYIGLLSVALADGVFHPAEKRAMDELGMLLHLGREDLVRLYATLGLDFVSMSSSNKTYSEAKENAQAGRRDLSLRNRHLRVFGLNEGASESEIRNRYRNLVKKYHPDVLRSQGLPESEMKHSQKILTQVMESYEWLVKSV